MNVAGAAQKLADWWPAEPTVPDHLVDALRYLDADGRLSAGNLVAVGNVIGVVVGLVSALAVVLAGGALPSVLLAGCVFGGLPPTAVRRGPPLLAALRRTRALGETTGLVGRLVLRLRVDPALERAVWFAARTGDGPLAESLTGHVRRAEGRGGSGLDGFAAEWRDWDPTVERACSLVAAAARAAPADRDRVLDRALDAARDGTRDRLADFVSTVRGPVTGLYAFGVLLPLALVGVLPAARVAGVAIPFAVLVLCYDVLLPVGLVAASTWLLARRPVAFPPPTIPRDHPDVPTSPRQALLAGLCAGGLAATVAAVVVPWSWPVVGAGVGIGTFLAVRFRPARAVRDRAAAVEEGLPDALSLVGRRVAGGDAVEAALADAAREVPGETGELLAGATHVGETLRVDVRGTFLDEHGALAAVPSRRAREAAELFALAARTGPPAGQVLVDAGAHLDALRRVEARSRRELSAVTDTLANTAALFGPLVGGVTVAMTGRLDAAGSVDHGAGASTALGTGASAYPAEALGLAVGCYVLLLAATLTALSAGLSVGLDRVTVGYRVGIALATAAVAYVAAVVGGGLLV